MKLNGSEILVNCLLEQGVDTVFGFPGGAVLNIYDALFSHADKIRHILTCHEQGAAHAADGYARSTGKTGVVIATSGPGATNLVTGIATAYMDSVPLVAVTGNVSLPLLGKDSFQEVDIQGITMPITKHNYIVKDVRDLADTVREAFCIAKSGRPGPVLIDITKDVTAAITEYEPQSPCNTYMPVKPTSEKSIERAAEMIAAAKKPIIYAGGGVIISGAHAELREFADKIDAPVCLSLMGIGSVDSESHRNLGMIGMHGSKISALAISGADLLIAIGARFSDRVVGKADTFLKNAQVIHIDIDPAEINKNVIVTLPVVGDVKEALTRLNARVAAKTHPDWMAQIAHWKQEYPLYKTNKQNDFPKKIMTKAFELAGKDAFFTTEVGQHQMWAAQYLPVERPRSFITSGGLGTMGFGLGAAIGAQIANPGKRVFDIAGDGSFHMNLNELATAVTYDLPVIVLLMNNNVLGMVRQWQKLFYGKRYSYTTMNRHTDYRKVAEAFGAKGYIIKTEADIEPVLKEALKSGKPCVIDCRISSDANVFPMVPAGKGIHEQIYDIEE